MPIVTADESVLECAKAVPVSLQSDYAQWLQKHSFCIVEEAAKQTNHSCSGESYLLCAAGPRLKLRPDCVRPILITMF